MKKFIIIGVIFITLLSSPLYAAIIDNGDSTVTDTVSGLMWRKYDNGSTVSYAQAIIYVQNLNYGKYMNWRLPTIDELITIYHRRHYMGVVYVTGDTQDNSPFCYFCWSEKECGISFCNGGRVMSVRNPQYYIDKIYTQAQIDTALEAERLKCNLNPVMGLPEIIQALQVLAGQRIR